MLDRQGQFARRQRPVEHFHRAVGAADQPGGQPQLRLQWQVGVVDQQQRRTAQLAVVVVEPGAQFAAQPTMEEPLFHPCAELPLPALFESAQ
ncbi:hypothetical protein D3C71_1785700 [compost metagenome]